MKSRLLDILRTRAGSAVSCRQLSEEFVCPAARVEEAVQELNGLGYIIATDEGGYRLLASPDIPFPWEIPEYEERLHYFPQTDSTMDVARQMAKGGCPHKTVVVAGTQRSGRGRLNRSWYSEEGGLYFTMVLRPDIRPADGFKLTFLASLTLVGVLQETAGIETTVKWPNDILAGGRKICGLLAEMDAASGAIEFVNIGIGINVNNRLPPDQTAAASVEMLAGRRVSRTMILRRFLERFEANLRDVPLSDVIRRWKKTAGSLQKRVTVETCEESIQGTAEDVDSEGALIVRTDNGRRRRIVYGDCFYR